MLLNSFLIVTIFALGYILRTCSAARFSAKSDGSISVIVFTLELIPFSFINSQKTNDAIPCPQPQSII